jgi:hypothetical protein
MASYINLGATCSDFNQVTPDVLPYGQNIFYILGSTTQTATPLKYTEPMNRDVITQPVKSNVVVYSDYQFKLWWDPAVVRSNVNVTNWRVLTKATSTSDNIPTDYTYVAGNSNVITTASPWPSSYSTFNSSYAHIVTFPGAGNNAYLVGLSHTAVADQTSNVFTNLLGGPGNFSYNTSSPYTSTATNAYYLRENVNNSKWYVKYENNSLSDFNYDAAPVTNFTPLQFRVFIKRDTGRLSVGLSTNSSFVDLSASCTVTFDGTNWGVRLVNSNRQYIFETSAPSLTAAEQGFPTSVTMLKLVNSNNYLYWNGTFGVSGTPANFSVKDYWASGLSTSNVVQGMQFYFVDKQATNAPTNSTGMVDWYRWAVHNSWDRSLMTSDSTKKANVVAVTGGAVHVTNGPTVTTASPVYTPVDSEGWVLQSSSSSTTSSSAYALVYAKISATDNLQKPVCYANVNSNNDVVFVAAPTTADWTTTSIPTHAYSWNCFKCTPSAANQTCAVNITTPIQPFTFDTSNGRGYFIGIDSRYIYSRGDGVNGSGTVLRVNDIVTGLTATISTMVDSANGINRINASDSLNTIYIINNGNSNIVEYKLSDSSKSQLSSSRVITTGFALSSVVTDGIWMYVATMQNNSVMKYAYTTNTLQPALIFTTRTDGVGTVNSVALDSNGDIYVTYENGATGNLGYVLKFPATSVTAGAGTNSDLNFILDSAKGIYSPRGIAVDDMYVYVANFGGKTVSRHLKTNGNKTDWSGTGITNGVITDSLSEGPFDIRVDSRFIYVSTWGNTTSVYKFDKTTGLKLPARV